jgi:predicted O-methyltransferase YrrM
MSVDYVSDNLSVPNLDRLFPNMIVGSKEAITWPYFRKEIDHTWYVDRRDPQVGFINKDEAAILFSNARLFAGRRGLEIGAWRGWSTCHLLVSELASLHVIEPLLADADWNREFVGAIEGTGEAHRAILVPGPSPDEVVRLGETGCRWSFVFIDGDHDGQAPTIDALACERYLEPTAMILFHDLVSPHVSAALRALNARGGWSTRIYQTAQMIGVAWRGDIAPVRHRPDPNQKWRIPDHLTGFAVSNCL